MQKYAHMSSDVRKLETEGLIVANGKALDLGCGTGKHALALAERGYTVTAVDLNEQVIATLKENSASLPVTALVGNTADFEITPNHYDVIFARATLPFLPSKEIVRTVIARIIDGLKSGGIAHVSLFGDRDEWVKKRPHMTFFTEAEMLEILTHNQKTTIYNRVFEEGYGLTNNKELKYWHVGRFWIKKI